MAAAVIIRPRPPTPDAWQADAWSETGAWLQADAWSESSAWLQADAWSESGAWLQTHAWSETGAWCQAPVRCQAGAWLQTIAWLQTTAWCPADARRAGPRPFQVGGSRGYPGGPAAPAGSKPMPGASVPPGPVSPPPADRKAESTGNPTKPERRTGRRIIGLHPRIAEEAGMSLAGRPARKRPGISKRPPRKVFGIRRPGEGEDEG